MNTSKPTTCVTTLCLFLIALISSCKSSIQLNEDNLAWKTFDDTTLDQSVDLRKYTSPNLRDGQDSSKLVIVCSSGGGARAAAFNIGIMLELEGILSGNKHNVHQRNVLNEIDYFSTVSGGGWGVSSFIAYKYQEQKYSSPPFKDAITQYNSSFVPTDTINRVQYFPTFNSHERYLSNRADFRYFKFQINYIIGGKPFYARSDKTMTYRLNAGYLGQSYRVDVERKLNSILHPEQKFFNEGDVDEIMLGDVFKAPGEKPQLPMLITNSTNIDNYKLIPITPDRLSLWGATDFTHYLTGNRHALTPGSISSYNQIPLALGTKASSGIPFALTPSTFSATRYDRVMDRTVDYYMHLQDGGIVDQQAMHSAKAILRYHNEIKEKKNRIVFVIDASGSGVDNQDGYKYRQASRFYNLWRVMAPFTTPDAQYPLTRERIKLFENEYNCTVVYLGTEVLLDNSLFARKAPAGQSLPSRKKAVLRYFNGSYSSVKNDPNGFKKFNMGERQLLYAYISTISTWFSSKGTNSRGKYLENNPKGTANIMFLAGRGVVQLKREKIESLFK